MKATEAATSDVVPTWVVTLALEGSIDAIETVLRTYRAQCLILDEDDSPLVETERREAHVVVEQLGPAYEMQTQWSAGRIDEWARLVRSGLTPARAEQAIIAIHS